MCIHTHYSTYMEVRGQLAESVLFHVGQNKKLEAGCVLIYAAEDQTHSLIYIRQAFYTEPYSSPTYKVF